MNEKGFAATGILYTILVLFILLLLSIITMLYSRNNILNAIRNDVKGGIYNVVLNIKGEEITQRIENNTVEFAITEDHISGVTNIVCNKNVDITMSENKIVLNRVLGGTECTMNTSLSTTINNLNRTENYVTMLSDEAVGEELLIEEGYNVSLNLNGKTLSRKDSSSDAFIFRLHGRIEIDGNDGYMGGTGSSIVSGSDSELIIDGGTYNYIKTYGKVDIKNSFHKCTENKSDCYPIRVYGNKNAIYDNIQVIGSLGKSFGALDTSNVIIKNSKLECISDNCVWFNSEGSLTLDNVEINAYGYAVKNYNTNGKIEISNSKITAAVEESSSSAIEQTATGVTGVINIKNSTIESYHTSLSISGSSGVNIYNSSLHSLNKEGNDCVYIGGGATETSYLNISSSNIISDGSHGLRNHGSAKVYLYNSNVTGAGSAIVNSAAGIINISSGTYTVAGTGYQGAISNRSTGTINICAGTVNGLSSKYDLYNVEEGYINYSSNVVLKNNKIYDPNSHVILNNNLKCQ